MIERLKIVYLYNKNCYCFTINYRRAWCLLTQTDAEHYARKKNGEGGHNPRNYKASHITIKHAIVIKCNLNYFPKPYPLR